MPDTRTSPACIYVKGGRDYSMEKIAEQWRRFLECFQQMEHLERNLINGDFFIKLSSIKELIQSHSSLKLGI